MYFGLLHVKYRLFLSDFNQTWFFQTEFKKTLKYKNVIKILLVEAETDGRTDGETDMTKLTVAFRNFANALEKRYVMFLRWMSRR